MPDSTQVIQMQGDPLLNLLMQYMPHGLGGLSVFVFVLWKFGVLNRFLKALSGFLLALTKEYDDNTKQPEAIEDISSILSSLEGVASQLQSLESRIGEVEQRIGSDSILWAEFESLKHTVENTEKIANNLKTQIKINKSNIEVLRGEMKEFTTSVYAMQNATGKLEGLIEGIMRNG